MKSKVLIESEKVWLCCVFIRTLLVRVGHTTVQVVVQEKQVDIL